MALLRVWKSLNMLIEQLNTSKWQELVLQKYVSVTNTCLYLFISGHVLNGQAAGGGQRARRGDRTWCVCSAAVCLFSCAVKMQSGLSFSVSNPQYCLKILRRFVSSLKNKFIRNIEN